MLLTLFARSCKLGLICSHERALHMGGAQARPCAAACATGPHCGSAATSRQGRSPSRAACRPGKERTLAMHDADMSRLASLTEDVLAENVRENVKFLSVDCTPLKQVHRSEPDGRLHRNEARLP